MASTLNLATISAITTGIGTGRADGNAHARSRMSTPCARILAGMQRAEEIAPFVAWHDPQCRHER